MGHERNGGRGSGGGSNGGGGDRGRDAIDDFSAPDDETVVIVTDEYTRGAIGRLADGLRGAADLCDGFREGGEADSRAEKVAVLGELRERLEEIEMNAAGAKRGVARLEREELQKGHGA